MSTVLVADDEETMVRSVCALLRGDGFDVIAALTGAEVLEAVRAHRPDLILLDVMLPVIDGIEVCRRIRARSSVPIIMLSARTAETSRVAGLEAGADDYVTKPFSARELMARVRAHLRRLHPDAAPVSAERLEAGDVVLDAGSRRVMVREREVRLTPKEFELLFLLMKHPGRVLERNVLLDRVWGEDFRGDPQTLHVHIRWLREKIEAHPGRPQHIETVHGVGYRFRP